MLREIGYIKDYNKFIYFIANFKCSCKTLQQKFFSLFQTEVKQNFFLEAKEILHYTHTNLTVHK